MTVIAQLHLSAWSDRDRLEPRAVVGNALADIAARSQRRSGQARERRLGRAPVSAGEDRGVGDGGVVGSVSCRLVPDALAGAERCLGDFDADVIVEFVGEAVAQHRGVIEQAASCAVHAGELEFAVVKGAERLAAPQVGGDGVAVEVEQVAAGQQPAVVLKDGGDRDHVCTEADDLGLRPVNTAGDHDLDLLKRQSHPTAHDRAWRGGATPEPQSTPVVGEHAAQDRAGASPTAPAKRQPSHAGSATPAAAGVPRRGERGMSTDPKEVPIMRSISQATRGLPLTARLDVDPDRLDRLWAMTAPQRRQAARDGQFSLGEMLRWAARAPEQVPLLNGEFFFIAAMSVDREPSEGGCAKKCSKKSST